MRASLLDDPLYDPDDDPLLLSAETEPMKPIRATYVTLTGEKRAQTDLLEQLGCVYAYVGAQNLFYLDQADSLAIRGRACALLMHAGNPEPDHAEIAAKAEAMLVDLVHEQAAERYLRSAVHTPVSVAVRKAAQELRAEADEILARHGVAIKARVAHAVAESEAA